jgi:putative ABC transport system permease protein
MRLHRWIIAIASRVVPRAARGEWRAEWEAELDHREAEGTPWGARRRGRPLELFRHSVGSFWDAVWVRSSGWHSIRFFGRHWRLAVAAELSLSVALAAIMIGLSAYNALLLRPPNVREPASLRVIHLRTPSQSFGDASFPEFATYRDQTQAFEDIAAFPYAISSIAFTSNDLKGQVIATHVSENFFSVLGIVPRLGRLDVGEAQAADAPHIVISSRLWRRIGGHAAVVGTIVKLNNQTVAIAGVVPDTFMGMTWGFEPDLWMSLKTAERVMGGSPTEFTDRRQRWLNMVGRLKPHVSNAQALSDLQLISARIALAHPEVDKDRVAVITPVRVTPAGQRTWTAMVVGSLVLVVSLVLVAAAANVTNLLLGLSYARRHEMLVRAALGASRTQLLVPPLREAIALGTTSGLLGCAAGWLVLRQISAVHYSLGPLLPGPTLNLSPDTLVSCATLATALLAGVAVGLGPAIRCATDGLSGAINRELAVAEPRKSRFRNALVVIQMAVATTVLIGVGISIRSLLNLEHAPLGFSARNLVFAQVPDITRLGYDPGTGPGFFERVREHLLAAPGIQAVTFASDAPLLGYMSDHVLADGESPGADGHGAETPYAVVDDRYFSTVGMPLLSGRTFDARDRSGRTEVVIVNATLAKRHWPGSSPIGQRLRIENGNRTAQVIGVVPDGKYGDVDEPVLPFMYFAMTQHYLASLTVIARTDGPDDVVVRSVSDMLGMGELPPFPIPTLADALRLSLLLPRLIMWVIVCFGTLALALAGFGLYSTIYYAVSQRRKEIGIRMSLGANPMDLFVMVLRQTGGVALAGAVLGLGVGLAVVPVVSSLFYGIRPVEPSVLGGVVLTSIALAVGATYLVIRPWARLTAIDLLRR